MRKAIPKKTRLEVYAKLDGHCGYCGRVIAYKDMQVDHIWPVCSNVGFDIIGEHVVDKTNHIDNLMPSCRKCNHYKRDASLDQFRLSMKSLHERLQKIYIVEVGCNFGMMKIEPFNGIFYFETKINH